ncbi:MAG TPA: hypothetical protein DDW76_32230 [Cyanobacteria bacterium UBA11369]|nr:hypothetical protein [Cyanobacteria bacterium UBA11371]HBE31297.1 hypothetical protein [Cyanobacteria bacterium UBA11368]HBE53302.1 hypothetical protein [Cyanobacteria bacterium UBA11369]
MNSSYFEQKSGYNNSGYSSGTEETSGYATQKNVVQGNFDDGYQENIYDQSNLADNAWTDSAVRPNPQLELEL